MQLAALRTAAGLPAGARAVKACLQELAYGASGIIHLFCLSNIENCNLALSLLRRRTAKRRFAAPRARRQPSRCTHGSVNMLPWSKFISARLRRGIFGYHSANNKNLLRTNSIRVLLNTLVSAPSSRFNSGISLNTLPDMSH